MTILQKFCVQSYRWYISIASVDRYLSYIYIYHTHSFFTWTKTFFCVQLPVKIRLPRHELAQWRSSLQPMKDILTVNAINKLWHMGNAESIYRIKDEATADICKVFYFTQNVQNRVVFRWSNLPRWPK